MHIELRDFTIHTKGEDPLTIVGRVTLRNDGMVEFNAPFPPEYADKVIAAFLNFAAAQAVRTEVEETNKARRELFIETTGLHGCFTPKSVTSMSATIALQRDKINGLKQQMRQMKKGYERKIARLEKLAANPAAEPAPLGTYSYKITAVEGTGSPITSNLMSAVEKMGYDAKRAGAPRWAWPATVITERDQEDWFRGWDRAASEP